jgi:hypothetical protein
MTITFVRRSAIGAAAVILLAAAAVLAFRSDAGEAVPIAELSGHTHFHGLAVDRADLSRLSSPPTTASSWSAPTEGRRASPSNRNDYIVRAIEPDLKWGTIGGDFGERYLLHLAVVPGGERLYAVAMEPQTDEQALLISTDGGKSWSPLLGG